MKKRPFILLEILIALLLVIVCAVPLVKQPLKFYKDERENLIELEKERLADWTFTEVKEILLKNEIPWEKIPAKDTRSDPFDLPSMKIELPGCRSKTIQRKFVLQGKGKMPGKKNEEYRQIYVWIHLDKSSYKFHLPIQKINIE